MTTKPTKPSPPEQPQISPAKTLQELSEAAMRKEGSEELLPVTLRDDKTYEYHRDLSRAVIAAILDPDVPDVFIEVPCPVHNTKRFLHTSYIKEIDVRGL